jgi:hypothetical protein
MLDFDGSLSPLREAEEEEEVVVVVGDLPKPLFLTVKQINRFLRKHFYVAASLMQI